MHDIRQCIQAGSRCGDVLPLRTGGDEDSAGGSTWRGPPPRRAQLEADYLNGGIALLGRLRGASADGAKL
ncbi:hypothetical protein GCM10018962_75550 [Dactylosporangium matsuzakiense]|uniref:Uncharacterized protein n=1 Tax=Dactylosporangium matsuzakiense TaxID=53360 RepID=A0A9W6NSK4_9ACTN|nr:hypothetical protein GCM10017581_102180 [Dactylosporangium matsuzakiense]